MLLKSRQSSLVVCLVAILAMLLPLAWTIVNTLKHTGGRFCYPLDDTFIHMEIARNFAETGTWGINSGSFTGASSSLLYTLLLAGSFLVFGVHLLIPLIINLLATILLIVVIQRWLGRKGVSGNSQILVLLTVVILTPLHVLVLSGMEHTLQCLFAFLLLSTVSDWATVSEERALPKSAFLYAILLCATRYEGLFLVGMVCLWLKFRKRLALALILGLAAIVPAMIFGIFSISHGGYFLPNSVWIKSEPVPFSLTGLAKWATHILVDKITVGTSVITFIATQRLLIILPLFLLFRARKGIVDSSFHALMIVLGTVVLQLALASTGWFYRYEAWLILLAIVFISLPIVSREIKSRFSKIYTAILAGVLAVIVFFPFILRSAAAYTKASRACINIYEQQYQMGKLVEQHFPNKVAANDIGAVSFLGRAQVIDLWGLGNNAVARSRKEKQWGPVFLDSLVKAERVDLVMIYDSWFTRDLYAGWSKLATWTISDNVICGDATVSFYSVDSLNAGAALSKLRQFQSSLPSTVAVQYFQ